MAADPRAIANIIIKISNDSGFILTKMKLIKLVFFAHGWALGVSEKPLSSERPEAWQYGPVFRSLYDSLASYGAGPITSLITDVYGNAFECRFDQTENEIIRVVTLAYGDKHAYTLSDLTHESGSPWDVTVKKLGHYHAIDDAIIQDYFKKLRTKNERDLNG